MPQRFLQQVASDVYARMGADAGRAVYIFPNKRPDSYFRQALSEVISEPILSPVIFSIEEFIYAHTTLKQADPLHLLFQLYEIYSHYRPNEEFDRFYAWGNLLLRDFDEIDRYLVDTRALFRSLGEIREIETSFLPMEEAEFEAQAGEPHYLQKQFLKLWELSDKVYNEFIERLYSQQLSYPGLAYRELATRCIQGAFEPQAPMYVFIGFNALSRSEEAIIQSLLDQGRALIYWDADWYYIENEREEAGRFIRRSMSQLKGYNPQLFSNSLVKDARSIHILGVPLKVGQAKALGHELMDFLKTHQGPESKAIVLPDENLLLPVLHSLPPYTGGLNITAGFPLHYTALFTFFENVISLQQNFLPETRAFYYKDMLSLLAHPYLRCLNEEATDLLTNYIEKNELIYISLGEIKPYRECTVVDTLFKEVRTGNAFMAYFSAILAELDQNASVRKREDVPVFAMFRQLLEHLGGFLLAQHFEVSRNIFLKLFREGVRQGRLSLTENRDNVLQIMGTLETRCLNFDYLFILTVNEGALPAARPAHSFMPFDVRKAFGLPTFEEQDALFAYYFYRLIQGSREVFLFYNSETGSKAEEKSRYIRQIEHFLQKANPALQLMYRHYSLPLRNIPSKEIVVEKDARYFEALRNKNELNGLSPSLISSYFVCSLQFLLQHIIQLRPMEEATEEMEANDFGTLFHNLMEEIYADQVGKTVTAETIRIRKLALPSLVSRVLENMHKSQAEHVLKRNSLLVETIKVLAEKTLDEDEAYAPFEILAAEQRVTYDLPAAHFGMPYIRLSGIIDRVDRKDGRIRIVDYKTGHVKKYRFDFRQDEEISIENKESFQTIFYAWLYHKTDGAERIQPTLLSLRKINEGYKEVNSDYAFNAEDFHLFEEQLLKIVSVIFNKESPVSQIDDQAICSVCNYNNFCLR